MPAPPEASPRSVQRQQRPALLYGNRIPPLDGGQVFRVKGLHFGPRVQCCYSEVIYKTGSILSGQSPSLTVRATVPHALRGVVSLAAPACLGAPWALAPGASRLRQGRGLGPRRLLPGFCRHTRPHRGHPVLRKEDSVCL